MVPISSVVTSEPADRQRTLVGATDGAGQPLASQARRNGVKTR